jgi:hypothetical protein
MKTLHVARGALRRAGMKALSRRASLPVSIGFVHLLQPDLQRIFGTAIDAIQRVTLSF